MTTVMEKLQSRASLCACLILIRHAMFPMAWVLVIRRARPHTAFEALFKIGAGLLTSAFLGGAGGGAVALAGGNAGVFAGMGGTAPAFDIAMFQHGGFVNGRPSPWWLAPSTLCPRRKMQALMSGMGSGQRPPINLSIIHVGNQAQANQEKPRPARA